MDPDHRLWMIKRKDRRHSGTEIITGGAIARITKRAHQFMPAIGNIPVVDPHLGWTRRKSVARQRRYDHIEVLEHRQQTHVIEETAGPAVGEDERQTSAGRRTLMNKMDALPHEVIERI